MGSPRQQAPADLSQNESLHTNNFLNHFFLLKALGRTGYILGHAVNLTGPYIRWQTYNSHAWACSGSGVRHMSRMALLWHSRYCCCSQLTRKLLTETTISNDAGYVFFALLSTSKSTAGEAGDTECFCFSFNPISVCVCVCVFTFYKEKTQ